MSLEEGYVPAAIFVDLDTHRKQAFEEAVAAIKPEVEYVARASFDATSQTEMQRAISIDEGEQVGFFEMQISLELTFGFVRVNLAT